MGFYIDMISVGQGDAFLLTLGSPQGDATVLIDGGPPSMGATVAQFVTGQAGGHLNLVIGTHLDIDHIGGFKDVMAQCQVDSLFLNVPGASTAALGKAMRRRFLEHSGPGSQLEYLQKNLEAANDLVQSLERRHLAPQSLLAGKTWQHGDCVLSALNPTRARLAAAWAELEGEEDVTGALIKALTRSEAPDTSAENDASVVLELTYGGIPYALFTADAGAAALREVTVGKAYEFLKVSHHGSETGMDDELAAQFAAKTAFIPVGENSYGHPATEVLDMLREHGAATYCSGRTRHCRRDCPAEGFGSLCHRKDRDFRPGWVSVDPGKCANNR